MKLATFSIVAYDPQEKAWGVAVASKFLAAGALVSWAKADAGAIATQSYAKIGFGPDGLALLSQGKSAAETLAILLENDPRREQRQVGIVDAQGGTAAHTGSACHGWAGHKTGEGFSCQGNILAGPQVIDSMTQAYRGASGEMADRLVAALAAADAAGGDKRGRQSAAVLVVRPEGGYGGDTDRYLDLRVDDDLTPIPRLKDLVAAHHLFFGTAKPEDQLPITEEIASYLQRILLQQGYWGGEINGQWDEITKQAFWAMVGTENLEERWNLQGNTDAIDRVALDYLRRKFGP